VRTEYFPVALESFKDIEQKGGIVMNGTDQYNRSKRRQSNRHIYLKVSKIHGQKRQQPWRPPRSPLKLLLHLAFIRPMFRVRTHLRWPRTIA